MESMLSVMSVRKYVQGDSVPRIVPRVVVEILPHQHAELLTILRSEVVEALVQECKRSKSDGMVRAPLLCLVLSISAWEHYTCSSGFRQHLEQLLLSLTASAGNIHVLKTYFDGCAFACAG
jgi:hypothetical protein